MARSTEKKFNVALTIFLSILFFIVGVVGGFVGCYYYDYSKNDLFKSDKVFDLTLSFMHSFSEYKVEVRVVKIHIKIIAEYA